MGILCLRISDSFAALRQGILVPSNPIEYVDAALWREARSKGENFGNKQIVLFSPCALVARRRGL
jgi:hypothetical protein